MIGQYFEGLSAKGSNSEPAICNTMADMSNHFRYLAEYAFPDNAITKTPRTPIGSLNFRLEVLGTQTQTYKCIATDMGRQEYVSCQRFVKPRNTTVHQSMGSSAIMVSTVNPGKCHISFGLFARVDEKGIQFVLTLTMPQRHR